MNVTSYIMCPHCHNTLDNMELYSTEYDEHVYYDYYIGECSKCHKHYKWTEIFTFKSIDDFEELKIKEG